MAAMALRMAKVVSEAERRIATAERRARHGTNAGNIAGQFTDERDASGDAKVVELRKRELRAET